MREAAPPARPNLAGCACRPSWGTPARCGAGCSRQVRRPPPTLRALCGHPPHRWRLRRRVMSRCAGSGGLPATCWRVVCRCTGRGGLGSILSKAQKALGALFERRPPGSDVSLGCRPPCCPPLCPPPLEVPSALSPALPSALSPALSFALSCALPPILSSALSSALRELSSVKPQQLERSNSCRTGSQLLSASNDHIALAYAAPAG